MRVGWAPSIVSTIVEYIEHRRRSMFFATVSTIVTITIISDTSSTQIICYYLQITISRNTGIESYTSYNRVYISRLSCTARGCLCTTACFALRTVQRRPESSNEVLFDDRRETSRRRPLTAPQVTSPVVPWTFQGNNHRVRCCRETSTAWG